MSVTCTFMLTHYSRYELYIFNFLNLTVNVPALFQTYAPTHQSVLLRANTVNLNNVMVSLFGKLMLYHYNSPKLCMRWTVLPYC